MLVLQQTLSLPSRQKPCHLLPLDVTCVADPSSGLQAEDPTMGSRLHSFHGEASRASITLVCPVWARLLYDPVIPTRPEVVSSHPWLKVSSSGSLRLVIPGDCSLFSFIFNLVLGGGSRKVLLLHLHLASVIFLLLNIYWSFIPIWQRRSRSRKFSIRKLVPKLPKLGQVSVH